MLFLMKIKKKETKYMYKNSNIRELLRVFIYEITHTGEVILSM